MSDNYHTPPADNSPANMSVIRAPLAELDQAISNLALTEKDGHIIQEEGVDVAQQQRLNFTGNAVEVSNDPGNSATVVNITDSGHSIESEGTPMTQRLALNFTGDGVTVTDDSPDATVVDITTLLRDGMALNYQISPSVSSNNLVVDLKDMAGSDPSAASPVIFRAGNQKLSLEAALSVTVTAALGDIFGWDTGKIQANDAQLFVYLINNNGVPQLGVSPCPMLTTVATNFYSNGSQTGSAGFTNMVMSGTRHATNSCRVIGRINVHQLDNNNWQNPVVANITNTPVFETDPMNWTPSPTALAPMTLTSPVIDEAYYNVDKWDVEFTARLTATTATSASASVRLTAPIASSISSNFPTTGTAVVNDGGANLVGTCTFGSALLFIGRYDGANFSLGAGRIARVKGKYRYQ